MSEIRIVKNSGAQGDCLFRKVAKLPDGVVEAKRNGPIVVAHSETGHHHTVDSPHARLYEVPGSTLVSYLQMDVGLHPDGTGGLDVVHHRPWDTHETLRLLTEPGETWEIRRQREWTPEGWRRVED